MVDYQAHDGTVGPPKDNNIYKIGDPNPQFFFGGISNNFSYKNFDLSILGQFTYGNDILNYGLANGLEGYNVSSNAFVDWERRWRKPGDVTDMPRTYTEKLGQW